MKNFKKIVTLCSALLLTLGLACACTTTDSSTPENSESQSVSAPESSAPEAEENSSVSTPEEPEQPDEPEQPEEKVQYEEVGYFTQNVTPLEPFTCSHELDAGIYYVTSYNEFTTFNDYSVGAFAELTEDGTIEFDVCYNDAPENTEEVEVDYSIYKLIPLEMQEAEVTASFLADGAITPVNVTLAEAGVYSFTVNQDVSFFAELNEYEYLAYQNYYTLFADEANTQATLYIGGLASSYGDVELTLSLQKLTPAAVTTATQALKLTIAGDNAFAFTAEENGAYRIDFDMQNLSVAAFDDETNSIAYAFDSEYFEFDYAGEPVVFFAKFAGIAEDFVSPYEAGVTITRIGDEGYRSPVAPDELYLNPAFPQESIVPANSVEQNIPLIVNVSAMGDLSISWDNDKVKVYVGETLIEKGYEFTVEDRYSAPQFIVHNETATDQPVTFTLTEKVSTDGGSALKLGANAVTVTVTDYYANQTECTFTAEKAGKYRINTADGETNADVYDENDNWIEVFPYEFELAANGNIIFKVTTTEIMTLTTDVIDLVIEYFDEATQTWVQE